MEPAAGVATANALESATTVVEVAITSSNSSIIDNRYIQGSSSAHNIVNNMRPHGNSSSGDTCSISITILGPDGLDHLIDSSTGVERHTSNNNNIGERTRRTGTSRARFIAAARRGTSQYYSSTEHSCISSTAPRAFGTISRSTCYIRQLLPPALVDTI